MRESWTAQLGECLEKSQPVPHALTTVLVREKVLALKGMLAVSQGHRLLLSVGFLEVTSENTLATLKVQPSLQLIHSYTAINMSGLVPPS